MTVIKNQEEFAAIFEPLNRMRNSAGEIRNVIFVHIIDKRTVCAIHGGYPRGAFNHEPPFCWHVPVQFANSARLKPHVHAGDRCGNRQISNSHLPPPAAFCHAIMGHLERIFKGVHVSRVGRRWSPRIRIVSGDRS